MTHQGMTGTATLVAAMMLLAPALSRAEIGLNVDLGLGGGSSGGSGVTASADVGLGGGQGINADVDAGIGGGDGVVADADVSVGGSSGSSGGIGADIGLGLGGESLADIGVDLGVGSSGSSGTGGGTTVADGGTTTPQGMMGEDGMAFADMAGVNIATLPPSAFGLITVTQLDRRGEATPAWIDARLAGAPNWIASLRSRVTANVPLRRWLGTQGWTPADVVGFYRRTDGTLWLIVDDRV